MLITRQILSTQPPLPPPFTSCKALGKFTSQCPSLLDGKWVTCTCLRGYLEDSEGAGENAASNLSKRLERGALNSNVVFPTYWLVTLGTSSMSPLCNGDNRAFLTGSMR